MSTSEITVTLRSRTGRWVLAASVLASGMAFIDGTALNVALPALQRDLGASGPALFWVLNSYFLMLAALILPGGALGDRRGRRAVFMAGVLVFMTASLACGLAPDVFVLIAARAVQGLGGALMIPGSLALITALFDPDEKGAAIGVWSAATTVVTVAGPLLGGWLADLGLWRYVFFLNVPLGALAWWVLYRFVPETSDAAGGRQIDYPGAALATVGLGLLTYGLLGGTGTEGGELGGAVASSGRWLMVAAGAGALLAFLVWERHAAHPMLPLALFADRTFARANLLTLFLYGALGVGLLFLSLNLVQVQGYSPVQAGLTFLPFSLLMVTLARRTGGWVTRSGPRVPLTVGPALAGVGFFWLARLGLTEGPASYWTTFFPGIALFGLGMSLTVVPLTTTVMNAAPARYVGTASGVNNATTRVANVLAIAAGGALAVVLFEQALSDALSGLPLTTPAREALLRRAADLGNTQVPPGLSSVTAEGVRNALRAAFVAVYGYIMYGCAALAWLSALVGGLTLKQR